MGDIEQEGLIPMVGLLEVLLEEPVLNRRELYCAETSAPRSDGRRCRRDNACKLGDRRVLQEIPRSES